MGSLTPFVAPPPNSSHAELAAMAGEDSVRQPVRAFFREFPLSVRQLTIEDRRNRQRFVHSMKGSARLVGAQALSDQLSALEGQLTKHRFVFAENSAEFS